jgi:hypothetical protein
MLLGHVPAGAGSPPPARRFNPEMTVPSDGPQPRGGRGRALRCNPAAAGFPLRSLVSARAGRCPLPVLAEIDSRLSSVPVSRGFPFSPKGFLRPRFSRRMLEPVRVSPAPECWPAPRYSGMPFITFAPSRPFLRPQVLPPSGEFRLSSVPVSRVRHRHWQAATTTERKKAPLTRGLHCFHVVV